MKIGEEKMRLLSFNNSLISTFLDLFSQTDGLPDIFFKILDC